MIKQAVILCGGKGTRLGTLTKDMPKPLLPMGDRPFINHLIQEVSRYGIQEILLLTGHLGESFNHLHDTYINRVHITVHRESEPMDTWGGVVEARHLLHDHFLLMNGDSWLDYNLAPLLQRKPDGIHMVGRFVKNADRYETLNLNKSSVRGIVPRGEVEHGFINSGIYVVNRIVVEFSDPGPSSIERTILPKLAEDGLLTAETCQSSTYFIDIGVPEDYEAAWTSLVQQRTRPALFIDRDDTLTYDREGYTHHPDDMEWKPGARELIRLANQQGFYVFVVTNQGGVTKGKYEEHYILDFHRKMQYTLMDINAHIDSLAYEIELDSERRKPRPGMIKQLMQEWLVDPSRSLMIGDKEADRLVGENAGILGIQCKDENLYEAFRKHIE